MYGRELHKVGFKQVVLPTPPPNVFSSHRALPKAYNGGRRRQAGCAERRGCFWEENMANLDHIQQMLNTNEEYRRHFLQDPVGALARQGLQLSLDMQHQLRQMVSHAQVGHAAIPGAAAGGFGLPTLGKVGPGPTLGKMGPGTTRQIPITIFIKI